jgi:hypothetical protein
VTDQELARLEELADSARRAVKAADRLNRIAAGAIAALTTELRQLQTEECEAEGGKAHDHQHRELREHAHA